MVKKTFILPQFGNAHEWTQKYIDTVQKLAPFGWEWKIFTPNRFESKGNVEIISMDAEDFNWIAEKKTGVNPEMEITHFGTPSFHMTDFNVTYGTIFEVYLKDSDFWGCIGWDTIMGRLDHFITDDMLSDSDIWSDDVNTINGTFCLFRNEKRISDLWMEIPEWQSIIKQEPCPGCMGMGQHRLYGSDEYLLTDIVRYRPSIRFNYPQYYPVHGHDRLFCHDIKMQDDGSLWELNPDIDPPEWIHKRPVIGREIAYFHFMKTKRWSL